MSLDQGVLSFARAIENVFLTLGLGTEEASVASEVARTRHHKVSDIVLDAMAAMSKKILFSWCYLTK